MIAPVSSPNRSLRGRVGVVLLSRGGPASEDGLAPYLEARRCARREHRYGWLPDALCRPWARLRARRHAQRLRPSLTHVGGAVPDTRLVKALAEMVEQTLADQRPAAAWTVVAATAYGLPALAEAAARLKAAQVDRIVVVPLVSVWVDELSQPLVSAWSKAQAAAGLSALPTHVVAGFAELPGYAEAIGERIGEGLQRFARATREGVQVVFALHPGSAGPGVSPLRSVAERAAGGLAGRYHVAYAPAWGEPLRGTPLLADTVEALVRAGERRLLVVPIGFVHETMDTAYELDVTLRAEAEHLGVLQYEVAACLNLHEAFVGTLATAVCDALGVPDAEAVAMRAA